MSHDRIIRGLARRTGATEHTLRILFCESSVLSEQARVIHQLHPVGTVALARGLTGGLLMAALGKSERNVNLQIAGDGPLGTVFIDADPNGGVRGYTARNPDTPLRLGGVRPNLGLAIGQKGYLNVMRADAQNNYSRGSVSLRTGEIDDDISEYLASSDQVESALALDVVLEGADGVRADGNGERVARAGGVLVQSLPNQQDAPLGDLRSILMGRAFYRILRDGGAQWPKLIAEKLGIEIDVLEETPVEYRCTCSEKRVKAALLAVGANELSDMIEKEGKAEITCDFCRREFIFDRAELTKLRDIAVSVALSHKDPHDTDDN